MNKSLPMESNELLHLPGLIAKIEEQDCSLTAYKDAITQARTKIFELLGEGAPVDQLLGWHSAVIDCVATHIWQRTISETARESLALVAVGGYGRAELHPFSDIDILVLTKNGYTEADEEIGQFVTHLWDLQLDLGHSVRDLNRCTTEAKADITVITNMIESRFICGNQKLHEELFAAIEPEHIWPVADFFAAKLAEQKVRHKKYQDTAFRLEPNIKESPGGLRDIQTIEWMLLRRYGSSDLRALVENEYLTEEELEELIKGRDRLWTIRFLLHDKSQRKEDRLVFDYQRELADDFGFETTQEQSNDGVEQFMQMYYRTVTRVERLNDMLLQLVVARLAPPISTSKSNAKVITTDNKHFEIINDYVEVVDDSLFETEPTAMLELFQVFAADDKIRGIGARTIRHLRSNLDQIDEEFRQSPVARDLFMELFREPEKITRKLRLMNRYGVLAAYIPKFEMIVGRMQYDLFHIYTVDEHTLMVIRNLRRFAIVYHNEEFPQCSEMMQSLEKPELLYIIGLFHDIAKGREGDHSVLGAEDALEFCRDHGLNNSDTAIVVWTIRHHLDMSMTAQRKDTSDPEVIMEFAHFVGSQRYLDYLYLLTVADIRGTNPELWNSWKENLLQQLYKKTSSALRRGLDNPFDRDEIIEEKQRKARATLLKTTDADKINEIWSAADDLYFLQYNRDEICWHTSNMAKAGENKPLILLRRETDRGSTEIFIHVQDHRLLFSSIVTTLEQLNLDIVSAQILTSKSHWTLNTFFVLDLDGETIQDKARVDGIKDQLEAVLIGNETPTRASLRPARKLTHFDFDPEIKIDNEISEDSTQILVTAIDRPGLLSDIGKCFADQNLRIVSANITTLGEKAEDTFYIQTAHNEQLKDKTKLLALKSALKPHLEN